MSRKNNLQRRKVQQSFDQRREEELKAKQEAKRERKAANHEAKQAAAAPPAAVVPQAHALPVASNGVSKPQRKQKQKGFRVKKNVMVKGIKIKDSESRKEALRRLKEQQALDLMKTD